MVFAQEEEQNLPYGRFIRDSVMLGEEIQYTLRYEHSPEEEVLFPDSTFNFEPFELLHKKNFNTRTLGNVSIDCVIYSLATYEIDSVYELGLPVLRRGSEKTDTLYAYLDGVFLKEMIPVVSDTTTVIVDANFLDLKTQFNTPMLVLILGFLLLAVMVFYAVFGNKFRENWRKKKIQKHYNNFRSQFDIYLEKELDSKTTEEAVAIWKAYLSKVSHQDIQPLTSKETGKILKSDQLEKKLKILDRVIYSGFGGEEAKPVLKYLNEIATKGYAYEMVNNPDKPPFVLDMTVEVEVQEKK